MKEFMFLIRNVGAHTDTQSPEEHKEFLLKCERYIEGLKKEDRLIAAQPLARKGFIISGKEGAWNETQVEASRELQVGYYHIKAMNLEEAVDIAKKNPEFEYGNTARIEVRPIKMKEDSTGFVYPK